MSKEMIISVNGREKKIAIIDDGRVTEFYIERGEENSGVVGNIYKGRVMRVLPGMQSAFVDIGLERDAFLYVSDFFDEEEEIERIVMEKAVKVSPEEAEREATDHIYKERLKREKQMEEAQELAEPLAESIEVEADKVEFEAVAPNEDVVEEAPRGKRGRGRRDRKPVESEAKPQEQEEAKDAAVSEDSEDSQESEDWTDSKPRRKGVPPPVFEIDSSGFERIIDDTDTGEMFKDAYMQEAIFDKVRAVEFEMEGVGAAEVGSLIGQVGDEPNGFQRIADEDEEPRPSGSKSTGRNRSGNADADSRERQSKKPARKSGSAASKGTTSAADAGENPAETASGGKSSAGKKSRGRRKPKTADENKLEDAQAGVHEDLDPPANMAVRRGGRGRRRPGAKPKSDEIASENDDSKRPAPRKDGNGNRRGGRRQGSAPTITDLLGEGQEILVQIAKEPIARKGARITSHIALPGRFLVYMPTIEHLGVSRKIESAKERARLRTLIQKIKDEVDLPSGGFIVRTAGIGISEEDLGLDARYLVRTWLEVKQDAEKAKSPELVHQDLDIILRLLRDHLSDEYSAIRVDSEEEYGRIVEFVNLIQPRMVKRVKFYTRDEPILEAFGVQEEINKALKPRVWLRSGGYLVINQTEALVAIDVNTGKFVGKGNARLEDTITKTNMEAVEEIARQIRLRDLGGIIVLDLIDMEDRRNRHKVLAALQDALASDKSPNKVLSFNDFGLIIMTRKRVKQSLERTLCSPCDYCQSAGWVKSPQTVCYEILEESRRLSKNLDDVHQTTLRVHPDVAKALRESEGHVLEEIEFYLGNVDVTGDSTVHQEQFDFAFI